MLEESVGKQICSLLDWSVKLDAFYTLTDKYCLTLLRSQRFQPLRANNAVVETNLSYSVDSTPQEDIYVHLRFLHSPISCLYICSYSMIF